MKPIEVTFDEKDLAEAGPYTDIDHCIMATALKRRGHNVSSVGASVAHIGGYDTDKEWIFDPALIRDHLYTMGEGNTADYKPSMVGTKVVLYHNPLKTGDPRSWKLSTEAIFNLAKADAEKETHTESQDTAMAQEVP